MTSPKRTWLTWFILSQVVYQCITMHLVLELSEEDFQLVEKASAESGEDALAIAIRGLLAEC
ncbi:MAG: hypothetical protein ACKPA7_07355, partial [Sphaerospermopsis kisseleviana]